MSCWRLYAAFFRTREGVDVLLAIVCRVLLQRIFIFGERSHGPVKMRDVGFVEGFGSGCGQSSKGSSVKTAGEAEDGQLGSAWSLVHHHRVQVLLGRRQTASDFGLVTDEASLECVFISGRAT